MYFKVTRTRAGPSKPVSKPKSKQAREAAEEDESDDFTEMVRESAEEDEVLEVDPPRTRKPASRSAGKSAAKGKGKAKINSAPTKKPPSRADIEVVDDDDDIGAPATARAVNDATANNGATKLRGRADGSAAATKQIESLRRQLTTVCGS